MKRIMTLTVVGLIGTFFFYEPSIEYGPGVLAPNAPLQVAPADPAEFEFKGYTFKPLADFSIQARVLGRERYRSDRESNLAPIDLILGWGRMSDSGVLAPFTFSQSGRWFRYKTNQWTIPKSEVIQHSANMHIIPSTAELESKLNAIVVGQVISLEGSLVHVKAQDGWQWKSSMTRKDSGAGSCEVIWLRSLETD